MVLCQPGGGTVWPACSHVDCLISMEQGVLQPHPRFQGSLSGVSSKEEWSVVLLVRGVKSGAIYVAMLVMSLPNTILLPEGIHCFQTSETINEAAVNICEEVLLLL